MAYKRVIPKKEEVAKKLVDQLEPELFPEEAPAAVEAPAENPPKEEEPAPKVEPPKPEHPKEEESSSKPFPKVGFNSDKMRKACGVCGATQLRAEIVLENSKKIGVVHVCSDCGALHEMEKR